jgi:uncharacterized protein (UPF0216 family)
MLQECLAGELRLVNAGLPQTQKRLAGLLSEEHPCVVCNDGSTHFFKKNELEYLADMLDTDDRRTLLLPMLIELDANRGEAAIMCDTNVEAKIVSKVLGMPATCEKGRIKVYRPQLALLRKKLKTTTVYVFSLKTGT